MGTAGRAASIIITLIQIVCSVLVLVITAWQLQLVNTNQPDSKVCALDGISGDTSPRICSFTYVVAGMSLAAALLVLLAQMLTACFGKLPQVVNIIFQLLGVLWWVIGAAVITKFAIPAFEMDFPRPVWRALVVGLSWLGFTSFVVGTWIGCVLLD